LHKILCLCNVWLSEKDDCDNRSKHNATQFGVCKDQTYSPNSVDYGTPAAKVACLLTSVANHPGTSGFVTQEYNSFTGFTDSVVPCAEATTAAPTTEAPTTEAPTTEALKTEALVPIWTALQNARAYGSNGGLESTGGGWLYNVSETNLINTSTSDADSSVPPSVLGIEFKLGTSGEAAIGFHCSTTGSWTDVWGTSACYYAIYKHYDGATYISEPGQPLEPPTSVDPALLNPDWANDRWQLKITPTGEVEYFRNSVLFYSSYAQISGSFKLHAAFNENGKVTEVKFLYEATTAAPTTAAPTTT